MEKIGKAIHKPSCRLLLLRDNAPGYCVALVALTLIILTGSSQSRAESPLDTVEIGYAWINFHTNSGQLTGPPSTTPPGATVGLDDTNTLGLVYERKLFGPFSLALQTGIPPLVKLFGKGTAVSLGEVGEARAWFPAVLGVYELPRFGLFDPYVGAGVNCTFFTRNQISDSYTKAFGGVSSTGSLSRRPGAVGKIGTRVAIESRWAVDLSYSRYWIGTDAIVSTATPGFGTITRQIDVTANPNVLGLSVAYAF